jgi:hypothetical protein
MASALDTARRCEDTRNRRSQNPKNTLVYWTVIVVEPCTLPEPVVTVAVMVVDPAVRSVATPELLMVATLALLLVHETLFVRFVVDPSWNVPVAVNCCERAVCNTEGLFGVTAIDCSVLAVTIKEAVPASPSWEAVIVAVPVPTVVTAPALTVATEVGDAVHFAVEVTSFDTPLTVVPFAVKLMVWPVAESLEAGVRVTEAMESPEVKKLLQPLITKMGITDKTKAIRCTRRTDRPPRMAFLLQIAE